MNEYNKEYNIEKGKVRVEKVKRKYESRGYKVTVNPISEHEIIDAIAENDTEVIALEITNWNKNGQLKMGKMKGWKRHWNEVKEKMKRQGDKRRFIKKLIYNYPENIKFMSKYLNSEKVELEEWGYEDYPEEE